MSDKQAMASCTIGCVGPLLLAQKALKELVASDCVEGSECNWLMTCLISAFNSLLGE